MGRQSRGIVPFSVCTNEDIKGLVPFRDRKKEESLVLNYLDFSPFTAVLLLIISPNPTQAAPASSELSSELSSRTEVAEWHSTYNTSELAFPETGKPFLAMLSSRIPS